jgi:hypothetical protein
VLRYFIGQYRQRTIKMLNLHGQGDLTDAQYRQELHSDLLAIEVLIAEQPFAVTETAPTHFDGAVWAYLYAVRQSWAQLPAAVQAVPAVALALNSKVLGAYRDRLTAVFFPDHDAVAAAFAKNRSASQSFLKQ